MTSLHLLSKSPDSGMLRQAGKRLAAGDGLLLLEDGVYCLRQSQPQSRELAALPADVSLYALAPDLDARGIEDSLPKGAEAVDYDGFVALCAEYDKTVSWF